MSFFLSKPKVRKCVYTNKTGSRCPNLPMEGSELCEVHRDLSAWDVVCSRIRGRTRITLPFEVRGVISMLCELLSQLREHRLSPEEGKAAAALTDSMIEAIKVGVVQKDKNFERRCLLEDRKGRKNHTGFLLRSPEELEKMTDEAMGNVVDVEHEGTPPGTEN